MHTLKEVSERCRKTENDVLRMAVNDEIVFFVRLTCPVQEQESGRVPDDGRTTRINDAVGFVPVENHYIEDLLSGETAVDVGCFHTSARMAEPKAWPSMPGICMSITASW